MFDLDDECVTIILCSLGLITLLVMHPYLEQALYWLCGVR